MIDINKLVLTPGEIVEALLSDGAGGDEERAISLATVKKYHKWGNELCAEHWKRIILHKDCFQCQQEITKALEEG